MGLAPSFVCRTAAAPETPVDRVGLLLAGPRESHRPAGSAWELTEQGTEQRRRQAASAPVAIASGHVHPHHVGRAVGINNRFHPGDGLGDRFLNAAVVHIELVIGLAPAIDLAGGMMKRCLASQHERPC